MRSILMEHVKKYPMMQPTDAVKLIYQNEFGGGHLIKDETACINYLFHEYNAATKNGNTQLYESIGNGMVRVNLSAVKQDQLMSLGQAFIRGAAQHQGNMDRFYTKREVLRSLTAEGYFSFDTEELQQYLKVYMAAGCPAVSHSDQYRQLYQPSYRVVPYCDLITENFDSID